MARPSREAKAHAIGIIRNENIQDDSADVDSLSSDEELVLGEDNVEQDSNGSSDTDSDVDQEPAAALLAPLDQNVYTSRSGERWTKQIPPAVGRVDRANILREGPGKIFLIILSYKRILYYHICHPS